MAEPTPERKTFSKDAGRLRTGVVKAKLDAKFPGKIKSVNVTDKVVEISAVGLTAAQWTAIGGKLETWGYHLDIDPEF